MATGRTLTSVSTLSNFNIPYKKTIGHKFRDLIATCGHYLKPVKKYIFPNFITVHYVYIIFMTLFCSILMYPCHNASYIDILFISCGAVTQGGLNTIDINGLKLYQQIIIYIICCLCTPIAIHGCLAFVRLYWFERYFDDIKNTSKRNFKMRRTRTILHREMTKRRTLTTRTQSHQRSAQNIAISTSDHGQPIFKSDTVDTNFQEKLFSGLKVNRDEQSLASSRSSQSTWGSSNSASKVSEGQSPTYSSTNFNNNVNNNSNANSHVASSDRTSNSSFDNSIHSLNENDNIPKTNKRATLQLPGERFAKRRKSEDVKPEDMYRSIMMLRERQQQEKQHSQSEYSSEDEEPVLFIKGRNITTSSIKVPMKKVEHDANSFRDNIVSPELSDLEVGSDIHHYTNNVDDDNDIDSKFADNSNALATSNNSSNDYNIGMDPPNDYTDIDSQISPTNTYNSITNDTAVSGISSESVSSGHSDSNSQNGSRNPSQHITFANNVAANPVRFSYNDNKDASMNNDIREGQSIQFNITAPPRKATKRKHSAAYHSKPVRPTYGKRKASSSRSILKHLKKGKKFQQNIQRRLSNSNVLKSASEVIPFENKQTTKQEMDSEAENNDAEEYFADNETDEDIPYDVSPAKLKELSKTPQFQKMVYKNWKANHGRGKKRDKDQKKKRGWMFDNEYGSNPTASTSNNHQHGIQANAHHDQTSNASSIGSISTNMTSASDNSSDYAYYMGTRHDYDEENQDDPAYFGLNFDFNASNTMHLPLSRTMSTNYLSWQPTIGRNSTFVGLTKSQRDELGGVEYRAIKLLCRILVVYYVGFHIMAFTMLLPWICKMDHYIRVVRSGGVSPAWWGFFTAMSAFNDLGLTLTPDSMNSFSEARYPLVVMMWFIIIGNTGFPIFLRVIIWVMFHLAPDLSQTKESLGFLLDHPRRCFTLLFPSSATWWLLLTLLFLNITDLILFIILDLGSKVLQPFARSIRVLIGAFQAVSTRTAGFSVVDLSQLHSAIQVSYMLMMYVSVLPLAISIRRTNVYEEQSLGLYGKMNEEDLSNEENGLEEPSDSSSESDMESDENSGNKKKPNKHKRRNTGSNNSSSESVASRNPDKVSAKSFVGAHLRKQLSFDLWFLFLGLFIICICENGKIKDDTMAEFNIFSILFEIVSAYGTVGLSLGYPNTNQSFSGQFTVISKLIIIAMLIRGRCRGLPYSLDRAILLPSERLEHIDHIEDLKLRRSHADTSNNEDPVTDYVKNTTGWIRNKFEGFSIPATGGNSKSESDPILQEYEMEENPNHHDNSNIINDTHGNIKTL
ncbi:high-affinity potassium transport protein [Monosporozyma servazzii]